MSPARSFPRSCTRRHPAYPKTIMKNVSREKDGAQDVYEVESVDAGLSRDINYRPDGTAVDVEEQVAETVVPAAVVSAIKTLYPGATLARCERLIKDGIAFI